MLEDSQSNYLKAVTAYNDEITNVWETQFFGCSDLERFHIQNVIPLFHLPQKYSPLWFIGMNPSFSLKKTGDSKRSWIGKTELTSELIADSHREQKEVHQHYPYFKKLQQFIGNVSSEIKPVLHDLYPVRHTNQNEFLNFLKSQNQEKLKKDLDEANLRFLANSKPRVIVILNAGASNIFRSLIFKKELPTVTSEPITIHQTTCTAIYAGMLSGQRAMDKYSQIRLADELRSKLIREQLI